jgi:hypothetical protein
MRLIFALALLAAAVASTVLVTQVAVLSARMQLPQAAERSAGALRGGTGDDAAVATGVTGVTGSNSSGSSSGSSRAEAAGATVPIPLVVFYTGRSDQLEIWGQGSFNRRHFPPETEFRFFDDDAMEADTQRIAGILSAEAGVTGALGAFKMLRPIAFKVDLWRAMALWENGGIYMDADVAMLAPLSQFVDVEADGLSHTSFVLASAARRIREVPVT